MDMPPETLRRDAERARRLIGGMNDSLSRRTLEAYARELEERIGAGATKVGDAPTRTQPVRDLANRLAGNRAG